MEECAKKIAIYFKTFSYDLFARIFHAGLTKYIFPLGFLIDKLNNTRFHCFMCFISFVVLAHLKA